MKNKFAEMDCFLLAGGQDNEKRDLKRDGDITRLERSYRRYAKVFEKVKLVLKQNQARAPYVNYPHICDDENTHGAAVGVKTALRKAHSDAVFIGTTDLVDFPLELAAELVKRYNGELFLGYQGWLDDDSDGRPLFGVFSRELVKFLDAGDRSLEALRQVIATEGTLVPLPHGRS